MRHLFIIAWLALSFFIDVSAFGETGRDYYMQGLDAYNNNLLMKAREYFEMACRAGYSDGCNRSSTMEKIISANAISDDSSKSSSVPSSFYIGKEFFSKGLDEYNKKQYMKALEYFEQACRAGFGAGCQRKREIEKIITASSTHSNSYSSTSHVSSNSGQEYYEKGLEAYNQDKPLKALEYFSRACDEGHNDGCARRNLLVNTPLSPNKYTPSLSNNTNSNPYTENISQRPIYCYYSDSSFPTTGFGDMTHQPTGNLLIDIPVLAIDIYDTVADAFHNHFYICSFTDTVPHNQSYDFITALERGELKYIVFYNGALSNYYKIYSSHQVKDTTVWPKTSIEYIGVIDANNNLIKLDKVKHGQLQAMKDKDWEKIKKFKPEK